MTPAQCAALTHPLCRWLRHQHTQRANSTVAAKQLRARAERVLLARHTPDPTGAHCQACGGVFPCLEWRVIATGWSHADGFDPTWTPDIVDTVDILDPGVLR